jgi:hypothetical protein
MTEKDKNNIETIFDHNVTEKELDILPINRKFRTKESYLNSIFEEIPEGLIIDNVYDSIKYSLSMLYWNRKNIEMAYKYARQIKDPQYRQDILNLLGGF